MRPLLSRSEVQAKAVLDQIYEHGDSTVLAGFKLSQVIQDRPDGITDAQWNYATRAHFDFVIADKDYRAEFAVELDDPTHATPDGQRRDAMKNALCEAAELELLRVESSALRPGPKGRRLIEYLIDARAMGQAFLEQQEAGNIPWSEPYDYRHFLGWRPDGGVEFVNDLAAPARLAALAAHSKGRIEGQIIRGIDFGWKNGWSEAWAWLQFQGDLYFFRKTRLRSFRFFCGMGPGELAKDLSVAAIGDDISAARSGEAAVLQSVEQIHRQVEAAQLRIDEMTYSTQLARTSFTKKAT